MKGEIMENKAGVVVKGSKPDRMKFDINSFEAASKKDIGNTKEKMIFKESNVARN